MTEPPTTKEARTAEDDFILACLLAALLLFLLAARKRAALFILLIEFQFPLIGAAALGAYPAGAVQARGAARDALQILFRLRSDGMVEILMRGDSLRWEARMRDLIVQHTIVARALGTGRNLLPSEVRDLSTRVFPYHLRKLDGFRRQMEEAEAAGRLIDDEERPIRWQRPGSRSRTDIDLQPGQDPGPGSGDTERLPLPTDPDTGLPIRTRGNRVSRRAVSARAGHYGGPQRAEWYRGDERNAPVGVVVDYISMDDDGTCGPCLDAEEEGPYLPGRGPFPGQVCLGLDHCRCERVARFAMAEYDLLRKTLDPEGAFYS